MYNLRYHIASLVSVFLALAIGLVLGGLAVGQGALEKQEGALIEGLEKEFTQLRDENRALVAENEMLGEFATDAIDSWVENRLAGRSVLVLASAGLNDGIIDARDSIASAGGQVAVATMLKPRFGLDDEAVSSRIAALVSGEDLEASIAASLAAEWAGPAPRPVTAELVEAGVLRVDDLPDPGVSALVLVAASDGEPDAEGLAIARAFNAPTAPAIGAETPASKTGVAAAASEVDLPALNTLGTQVGRYTLVALLTGAEPGYFGTGDGVDGKYPALSTADEESR